MLSASIDAASFSAGSQFMHVFWIAPPCFRKKLISGREMKKPISRREETEQEKRQSKRRGRNMEEACSVNYG